MGALREIQVGLLRGVGILVALLSGAALTYLAADGLKVFQPNQVVRASEINANFAALNAQSALKPPVGSIVAWHKSAAGVSSLPAGWLECDGSTVSDSSSPLNGLVLPDLNGSGRFLRGGSVSGTLQADELRSHVHQQTTGACCGGLPDGILAQMHSGQFGSTLNTIATGGAETRPINMSVVWIIRIK